MSQAIEGAGVADIVEEHGETFEIVAEGDDKPAECAQAWLQKANDE